MCNINCRRNAYKANVLLLLLSSLVIRKVQYSIGVATVQSVRYIELADARVSISKNALLCWVLADRVTYFRKLLVIFEFFINKMIQKLPIIRYTVYCLSFIVKNFHCFSCLPSFHEKTFTITSLYKLS